MKAINKTIFYGMTAILLWLSFGHCCLLWGLFEDTGKGKITLVDLGKGTCIPCKMMAPVLERVKKRFTGKAEVIRHRHQV
jgi:thioredoxin 1